MKAENINGLRELVKTIIIAVVIAVVVIQFVKPTIVSGVSMEPNFHEKNYLFLSKQSYRFNDPNRGDVVVFHSSLKTIDGEEKLLIKRVIGLAGDRIDISEGKVYINGKILAEEYIRENYTAGDINGLIVPRGQVFCMGDNRGMSTDSRDSKVGCIDIDQIVGKAVIRVFPFDEAGIIKNPFK